MGISAKSSGAEVGDVKPNFKATIPSGWLECGGQAVSRATYSALFLAIGTFYGAGDGSTTFNLPDLRGRALFGKDNMGGTTANRLTTANGGLDGVTLGAVGGGESVTLASGEMPSHTHTISQKTSGTGGADKLVSSGTYAISIAVVATSDAVGGGGSHKNIPPAMVTNFIIKA